MAIVVHKIVNHPVSSNCFIIYDKLTGNDCLIVDPGSRENIELVDFLNETELIPKYIILTHEHFDHCWGVNALVLMFNIPVVCSALCAENIKDIKKNCSVFYDNSQCFRIHCGTVTVESLNYILDFIGTRILFFHTPGHTEASISFVIDNYLFTGDTLIYKSKTITKLPTGSPFRLKQSLDLYRSLSCGLIVQGGHGRSFELGEYFL